VGKPRRGGGEHNEGVCTTDSFVKEKRKSGGGVEKEKNVLPNWSRKRKKGSRHAKMQALEPDRNRVELDEPDLYQIVGNKSRGEKPSEGNPKFSFS